MSQRTEPTLRDDERQRCEIWTRVMGYHRPVASFNIGKQGEFLERRHFVEAAVAPDADAPGPAVAPLAARAGVTRHVATGGATRVRHLGAPLQS